VVGVTVSEQQANGPPTGSSSPRRRHGARPGRAGAAPGRRLVLTDVFRTGSPASADLVTGHAEANVLTVLPDLTSYDPLASAANFQVDAVLDITANSRRATFTNAAGREHHDTMIATLGEESTALFSDMCTALAAAENLGYLLLTATRTMT
jgi:hypothetical protein